MRVEPGHINQLRQAENGKMIEIDKDVGGVAHDLQQIDAGLKVRFPVTREPCWIVYHEGHPGCPHNGGGGEHSTYLVATYQAFQNASGTWEGLDQRVVERMREIGSAGYDYAGELEKANRRAAADAKKATSDRVGELNEHAAHVLRKELGVRYRGRTFVPKDLP